MQFLKTLFWVILAVALVLFSLTNWNMVTINLWGGLQADIKLPVLVIGAFLIGFLPTWVLYRTRLWSLKRRLEGQAQAHVANAPGAVVRNPPARVDPDEPHDDMTNPIFVALDTTDPEQAQANRGAGRAARSAGSSSASNSSAPTAPPAFRRLAGFGLPIFLDLKLHDIPNTVAKAVQALRPLAPAILTVHAAGGRAMIEAAKAAAPATTKVVAVTVLTSLDDEDLAETGVRATADSPGRAARRRSPATPVSTASSARARKSARPGGSGRTAISSSPASVPPRPPPATRSASSPRARRSTAAPRSSSSAARSPRPSDPGEAARTIAATL